MVAGPPRLVHRAGAPRDSRKWLGSGRVEWILWRCSSSSSRTTSGSPHKPSFNPGLLGLLAFVATLALHRYQMRL